MLATVLGESDRSMSIQTLIVEDNESTQMLLESILSARGYQVSTCSDAESALTAFEGGEFSLVVLDWHLPGMDGIELCRRLRQLPRGDRVIIVMVTARNRPEDLRAVLDAGADDYIAKPFEVDSVNIRFAVAEGALRNLRERKRAEGEREEALVEAQRGRDDLRSILDRFRAGTALIDADGQVTFLNRICRELLDVRASEALGRDWSEALPVLRDEAQTLRDMAACQEDARTRVSITGETSGGRRWLSVEIADDPRDGRGKIFFVYDESDLHHLRRMLDERVSFHDLVGRSAAMMDVFEQIRRVAQVDSTVLLEGETGTGKELVARAIHYSGHRRNAPFVAVNCAGLTDSLLASQLFGHKRGAFTGAVADHKGFFEAADQGTIFLDEIGDIPPNVQTSLLRVLQEREILRVGDSLPKKIDVRVVAATHHDLAADVQRGTFRADLLYRIRVARVHLPPLRQRREDIPLLAQSFLSELAAMRNEPVDGVSPDALRAMLAYDWPGNVRELRAATEFSVIRCRGNVIQSDDLPPEVQEVRALSPVSSPSVPMISPADDRETILRVLEEVRGNRSLAAQRLGMSRSTFYRRLAEIGLVADTRR